MNKLIQIFIFIFVAFSAVAEDHNKFYGSISSDGDKRHHLNLGWRINDIFSIEGSYNQMEYDHEYYNGAFDFPTYWRVDRIADKAEAAMIWGKAQYDWNRYLTTYAKAGVGRFKFGVDYMNQLTPVTGEDEKIDFFEKDHYRTGYGLAVGIEFNMTENFYTALEYQHLKAKNRIEKHMGLGGHCVIPPGPSVPGQRPCGGDDFDHSEGGLTLGIGYKF